MRSITQLAAILSMLAVWARADDNLPRQLEGVGIDEKLGSQVDLDLTFVAENGYPVPLRTYFQKGRPVLLNLVYYTCPMLCNLILNGTTSAIREIPWTPGQEYEMVTVSIDPRDNFDTARKKKAVYLASYDRPAPGWHFLADDHENVRKLAAQVGFRYRWDEQSEQYAHAAAIVVLTPEGKVSRYLYGIKFKPRDLRLALTEASENKLGPMTVDRFLLLCFHYDPKAHSYVPFATNIMRGGGVIVVLILGTVLFQLFRRESLDRRLVTSR